MNDSSMSPHEAAVPDAQPDPEAARVAHAAAELGVPVPPTFRLAGVDDSGEQLAHLAGTAQDVRHAIAILARLNGKPVDECLADMTAPPPEGKSPAPWAPPADWTDTEAMLAWLAEHERHPEWPQFSNSVSEWATLVTAFLSGSATITAITKAIVSIHNHRARMAFARYVVDRALERGVEIDPVALISAANLGPAISPVPDSGPASGDPTSTSG